MVKKNFVKGNFVFEDKLEVQDDITTTGITTSEQSISIGTSAITYDGDFIDTITIGTRVVTYSNDGTDYTSWTDTINTWTPTYNGTSGLLEGVVVT